MTGTTNYSWPLIAESQNQKYQTHNDALQAIDTEVHSLATGGISLVAATDTVLGGIKVGEGLSMAVTSELLSVIYGTSSSTAAQGNDSRITGALQMTGGTMSAALHLSVPGTSDNSDKATSTSWVRAYVSGLGLGTGSGSVTSVALTVPGILSVAGSPVTTSGTLAVSLATQAANLVFVGPTTGSAATPTFRALVAADFPAMPYDIGFFSEGTMTTNEVVGRFVVPRALSLASGASGVAICGVAPTGASVAMTLAKNGTSIGTVTFTSGSTTGTVSITSSTTFASGDKITLTGPSSVDATLADPTLTLTCTR